MDWCATWLVCSTFSLTSHGTKSAIIHSGTRKGQLCVFKNGEHLLNVQPVKQRYPAILPTNYKRLLLIPLNLRVGKQLHLLIWLIYNEYYKWISGQSLCVKELPVDIWLPSTGQSYKHFVVRCDHALLGNSKLQCR